MSTYGTSSSGPSGTTQGPPAACTPRAQPDALAMDLCLGSNVPHSLCACLHGPQQAVISHQPDQSHCFNSCGFRNHGSNRGRGKYLPLADLAAADINLRACPPQGGAWRHGHCRYPKTVFLRLQANRCDSFNIITALHHVVIVREQLSQGDRFHYIYATSPVHVQFAQLAVS